MEATSKIKIIAAGDVRNYFFLEAVSAFKRHGCTVACLDMEGRLEGKRPSRTEVEKFSPHFVFVTNDIRPLSEPLREILSKCIWVSWLGERPIWPYLWRLRPDLGFTDAIHFVSDREVQKQLVQDEFREVHFLPLASNPSKFLKKRSSIVRQVCFVGSPMAREAKIMRDRRYRWILHEELVSTEVLIRKALTQISNGHWQSPLAQVEEIEKKIACQCNETTCWKRLARMASISYVGLRLTNGFRKRCIHHLSESFEMHVIGSNWETESIGNCVLGPPVKYGASLSHIYRDTALNINVSSQHLPSALNSRPFDVPCSGAFLITDYRHFMEELIDLEEEIVTYKNEEELVDKCKFYLEHPSLRLRIAAAGRKRVLKQHTYDHRILTMMTCLRKLGVV